MALFIPRLDSLQASQSEPRPTPQEAVAQAWEIAQNSNTYTFQMDHFQTTYSAPGIGRAGRQPEDDHVTLIGNDDQDAETLNLTFWQDASFNLETGVEIKVEDDVTPT